MLEVQKFLQENTSVAGKLIPRCLIALEKLKEEYGIKFNVWENQLVVLNYCQIDSPKTHPITVECRSLVLELNNDWSLVSRSFDRFFNLGEIGEVSEEWIPCPGKGMSRFRTMTFHEKMDGSLIGIFHYKGQVMYRTRSVIMPESEINGHGTTWKEAIEEALQDNWKDWKGSQYTLIAELTCRENRIVVDYGHEPTLTLLAVRVNEDGDYLPPCMTDDVAKGTGMKRPRTYTFSNTEACVKAVAELPDLEEGYVGYNPAGVPCVKIKNPAYVAAHHLRGDGLNEKRILDLILMNEQKEYLTVFPEDEKMFKPYEEAYDAFVFTMHRFVGFINTDVVRAKSQKDFALFFKDFPESALIFQIRKDVDWKEAFDKLSADKQRSLILNYKN